MIHILIPLAVFIFAVWLCVKLAIYIASQIAPPTEIVFVPFDANSDDLKKQAPALLSARLRELQLRNQQPPTGYGFLNLPLLSAVPQEAQNNTEQLNQLENIQLKIKDVDVPGVIKFVQSSLAPAQYELHGRLTELPESISVNCELIHRGKPEGSWQARSRSKGPGSDAAAKSALVAELLDQVLFQMVFDFTTKPNFSDWRISVQGAHRFGNWQALRAYVRGIQALRAYQDSLDHAELDDANRHFGSMAVYAPDDVFGLYFRGIALSEDRREAEAVATFEQLQRQLDPAQGKELDQQKLEMRLEAKLQEATTRLKLYIMAEGETAVTTLETLIRELKDLKDKAQSAGTNSGAPPATRLNEKRGKEFWTYSKLLGLTHAQLAYTHGTILALPRRNPPAPEEIEGRYSEVTKNIKLAENEAASVEGHWASEHEKNDVLFRIRNADGYSRFRHAELMFKSTDLAKFKTECAEAIKMLEQADRERPNHYEVLQNLAMIYEDEVFDPSGNYLDRAQALYERTKKFVPQDYYQYEQIAEIQWRKIQRLSTSEQIKAAIQEGKTNANLALTYRPKSSNALISLARYEGKLWELDKKSDANVDNAVRYYTAAIRAREHSSRLQDVQDEYTEFLRECAAFRDENPDTLFQSALSMADLARDVTMTRLSALEHAKEADKWLARVLQLIGNNAALTTLKQRVDALRVELQKIISPPANNP